MKHSFVRFLLVGIVNTIVGLSVIYFLLDILHFSYWIATLSGNIIGAGVSFFLNRFFTFNSKLPVRKGVLPFAGVILVCYVLSYGAGKKLAFYLLTMTHLLPLSYSSECAVLIGTGLYTITNYFGQKHLVFRRSNNIS